MDINLGLDIGVASVGWAVVNENYEVLELGSDLFKEANPQNNQERRGFRQARRIKRRQKTRKSDFTKLWLNYGFNIPNQDPELLVRVRVRALSEKINEEELFFVLKSALKHRGISYLEDAIDENMTSNNDYKKGLMINEKKLQSKYPCEIQLERYEKYGEYRGNITVTENGERVTLSNVFTSGAYEKEINKILKTQKQYNIKISDEFISKYLNILTRKREYYVGPGNELSRTDYGRYTTKIGENGEYITEENIFEKLIGKCSVYKDELRAASATYTAQEYNMLNDLNNFVINGRKLTEKEKCQIIETVKTSDVINMKKILSNITGEKIDRIPGARIDKDDKEIFFKFEQYNKMRKELNEIGFDISSLDRDELDKIGNILTLNTEGEAIINAINRAGLKLNEEVKNCLVQIRRKNGSLFNKWHSFSLKLMNEIIPEMYKESKNQMEILTEMGVFKGKLETMKGRSTIPFEEVVEEIYNPVVVRSVKIAINITNAIIKKYGNIKKIVIEMPRDKNSEEQKNRIKRSQRENEKELGEIIKNIKENYGITITDEDFKNHNKLAIKLKLWNEQNGVCPYSGKTISIENLLYNESKFEIDHIIPISISFDDSRSNKVLVYGSENQDKGQHSPFQYLININREWNFVKFKAYVLSNYKDNKYKQKIKNLLDESDINKIDVLRGFINRNINDTRYASRIVLNTIQNFFKANESDTKVKVIRGNFTHQMRVKFKLPKDRDEDNSHHAIDAVLICYSSMGYEAYKKELETGVDFETGEIIDINKYNEFCNDKNYEELLYQNKFYSMKKNIAEARQKVKYWYMVDRKVNRSLCNQTIRGSREYEGKTYKINSYNIYDDAEYKKLKKLIDVGKEDKLLMYKNDQHTKICLQ